MLDFGFWMAEGKAGHGWGMMEEDVFAAVREGGFSRRHGERGGEKRWMFNVGF